ncbi:class gamma glutathione S-transferase [Backusella circina FSU 941]|nr:class gamma glutathione S-transferase [Backusella circina FSU 941]
MEKITLYYLIVRGKLTRARGENIKLFLEDSGLEHEYVRVPLDETWREKKVELIKRGNYRGTVPYIEVGGKMFCGTVPVLRYLSTKLGKYNGSNAEEIQYIDTIVDGVEDWFISLKTAFFGTKEQQKVHQETELPNWLSIFEKYYGDNEGPYALGQEITYADIMVYHIIDDEGAMTKLNDYPNLLKMVNTFEDRPNIKQYLASLAA